MSEVEREGRGEQPSSNVTIPVEWPIPDNIQSQYASAVFVQPGQYEITLSFFEVRPPVLTGTPEENRATLEKLGPIQAKCVGRIIVDPDLIPKLIDALQIGLEGYHASKANQQGEIES
jgi:hypothetical protein